MARNALSSVRTWIAVGAVAAVAAAWSVGGAAGAAQDVAPLDPHSAMASPSDLRWHPDDRRAYRLSVHSRVALDAGGDEPVIHELQALLCLRVAAVDGTGAEVALQLRDVRWTVDGREDAARGRALGVPFVARFDGGLPRSFRFPAGLDGEIQQQLAEVVRTFQATVPERATIAWNALEDHATGRYRAAYAARSGGVWHKHKAAYLRGAALGGGEAPDASAAGVRVLESEATLTPATHASWWDAAQVVDELELSHDGQFLARVATRANLSAADAAWDPTADVAQFARTAQLLDRPVPVLPDAAGAEAAVEPRQPTAADRDRFRATVQGFVDSRGDRLAAVHELAALLREFPALAAELPPMLRDPELPGTVAAGLAHALELAGNDACQEALAEVGADPAWPTANRLRAIVALAGVASPTAHSVELLAWLAEAGQGAGDPEAADLSTTAVLALGRMGRTLRAGDPDAYGRLAAQLSEQALRPADTERRATALDAIGNTGDPDLAPVARRALDDAEPAVRAAAAQAFGKLDPAAGPDALSSPLRAETDGRVRAALVAGMRAMSRPGEDALSTCASLVEEERDPAARGAMARYLVDHIDRYPAARPVLERLLRTERDPATLSYVGGRLYRDR